jgi:hypothetical protein
MSLYTPIRNPEKYDKVSQWLSEHFPFIAGGSPEGFLMSASMFGLRKNPRLDDENDDLARAVRKVPTAFINVEWDSNTSTFIIKSADMVHVDALLEGLSQVAEQTRQVRLILELQDILRETDVDTAWFITGVSEDVAPAFGYPSTKARHHLFTQGASAADEVIPGEVVLPKHLTSLGKSQAGAYLDALKAYNPDLVQDDDTFEGITAHYLFVEQILAIQFPDLEERVQVVSSLLN